MKMHEVINNWDKESVYDQYVRIVDDFKDYERITRKKMLDAIYASYEDPDELISICTSRELKCLKKVLNQDSQIQNDSFEWEWKMLSGKFLIDFEADGKPVIPEEAVEPVQKALKQVNWDQKKRIDELNEIVIGHCKIQGSILVEALLSFITGITQMSREMAQSYMMDDRVFCYHVALVEKEYENFNKLMATAVCFEDYFLQDELDFQRQKYGIAGNLKVDLEEYKTVFYHDFNINNSKVKKFIHELKKAPLFQRGVLELIRQCALLNGDRVQLEKKIQLLSYSSDYDFPKLFKLMNEAMDEMPSGAMNGFTPKEANLLKLKRVQQIQTKKWNYTPQQGACLSKKDALLFYKLYFGLLEFTNKRFKIKPGLKIYQQKQLNPSIISEIIQKFWENKELLVTEFCLANPYKFNKEELQIIGKFKKGFRKFVILAKFEKEFTAVLSEKETYMIKGLHDNLDRIIPFEQLPYVVTTAILPFKDVLVYDGILEGTQISMGSEFEEIVDQEYQKNPKKYHL